MSVERESKVQDDSMRKVKYSISMGHYSTQKEERNCFKDVNQSERRFEQAIREQIVKVSAKQVLRCIWQFNLQMLLSSQTIEIIMFSAQLKGSACPLTLKAPQHMLHYSGVMSPSDGAHQNTSFQLGWSSDEFYSKHPEQKKVVCFGNQATRWFLFVRRATLWHSERKSTAIVCQLPSGSVVAAASWFVIVSPLLLAPLFGLTVINSVLHRLILVWSRWMPILTQAKGQTGTIAGSKHMLCASSDLISTVKQLKNQTENKRYSFFIFQSTANEMPPGE